MFLAFACYKYLKVYQMDVNSTFVNGELEEEVYMEQPDGFLLSNNMNYVCGLKKALYGLQQAPHAWYSRLDKYLQKQSFNRGGFDSNIYIKANEDELLIMVVYVDDIMFGSNKEYLVKWFVEEMKSEFEMSIIGELTFYLGLQILQNLGGIFISQEKYLKYMFENFQMEDYKLVSTTMEIGCKLCADDESPNVDQKLYRSMIGIFLYLTSSRPYIMLAIRLVETYQSTPKQSHPLATKRIFRYLDKKRDFIKTYNVNTLFPIAFFICIFQ